MRSIRLNSLYCWFFLLNFLLVVVSCSLVISSISGHGEKRDYYFSQLVIDSINSNIDSKSLERYNIKIFPSDTEIKLNDGLFTSKMHLEEFMNFGLGDGFRVLINPSNGDGWILDKKNQRWIMIPDMVVSPSSVIFVIIPLVFILLLVNFSFWWRVILPLNKLNYSIIRFQKTGFPVRLKKVGSQEIDNILMNVNIITSETYKSNRERARMISSIAHDLNSPITRIQLRSEFVDDIDIRNGFMRDCAIVSHLISQIKNYFNKASFSKKISVNDVCRRILLYPEFRNISFESDLMLPERVSYPEVELERIIVNLVNNSIEYGSQPVILQTKLMADKAIISVIDHGEGINEKYWSYALQPFVRLDKYRPLHTPHSGLGLATVNKLVEFLGGNLSSIYINKKFCVTVSLPCNHHFI